MVSLLLTQIACNAKVLTVYENQHRLAENFLDAARKKRVSWTPKGLWEAWQATDAAEKVAIGTLVGLLVSVRSSLERL